MIRRRTTPRPKALWVQAQPETYESWPKRKAVRPVSRKRAAAMAKYRARVKVWLESHVCCMACAKVSDSTRCEIATECHHVRGRTGKLLMAEQHWLPVCAECHRWITNHTEEARELDLVCAVGQWNNPVK